MEHDLATQYKPLTSGFLFGLVGRERTIEMTWAVPLPAVEIIPDSQFSKGIQLQSDRICE